MAKFVTGQYIGKRVKVCLEPRSDGLERIYIGIIESVRENFVTLKKDDEQDTKYVFFSFNEILSTSLYNHAPTLYKKFKKGAP